MNQNGTRRSIKLALALMILIMVVAILVAVFGFLRLNLRSTLEKAEQESVSEISRVIGGALETSRKNMQSITKIWACWEETYHYMQGIRPEFATHYFDSLNVLQLTGNSYMFIKTPDGENTQALGLNAGTNEARAIPDGLSDFFTPMAMEVLAHYLETGSEETAQAAGLVYFKGRAYMAGIAPIVCETVSSEALGVWVFAVLFDEAYIKSLTQLENTGFDIKPALEDAETEGTTTVDRAGLLVYSQRIEGLDGHTLSLVLRHQRTLYTNGLGSIQRTSIWLAVILLAVLALFYWINHHNIIRPITSLSFDVGHLSSSSTLDLKKYQHYSELHSLSLEINQLVVRLERNRRTAQEAELNLSVLLNILNGIDTCIYATDPKTDRIMFINDKMCRDFGLGQDAVGEICWKVLQEGFTQRCEFCPNHVLECEPAGTVVWEETNTVTGRCYRNVDCLIDWPNSDKVHLQHSTDITDMKAAEMALIHAKELAEQSSLAKSEFLSRMSHEMRTPMNAIIGIDRKSVV